MDIPAVVLKALELAINRCLELDPATLARMQDLQQKVIAIELRGVNLSWFVIPQTQGVRLVGQCERDADTHLRGTPLALARLALPGQHEGALFSGEVEISGDVEVGQRFKEILDAMDIDWEEHLSHLIGDVAAHHLGNVVRGTLKWGNKAGQTLAEDAAEYLKEERRVVPHPHEVTAFLTGVDNLRADVDRLEARVKRLGRTG